MEPGWTVLSLHVTISAVSPLSGPQSQILQKDSQAPSTRRGSPLFPALSLLCCVYHDQDIHLLRLLEYREFIAAILALTFVRSAVMVC